MKLFDNETIVSHRLATNGLSLIKSQQRTSNLNIPLKTSVGLATLSSSHPTEKHHSAIVGSVDLISDIHPQWSMEQPSSNVCQRRCRRTNSFINPTVVKDSIARLRRASQAQNHHRSSLQTVDKACESKGRLSSIRSRSIPKFSFRELPSNSRSSVPIPQVQPKAEGRKSPFTSLPEIRSFIERNTSQPTKELRVVPELSQLLAPSSWKRSCSWSWKSNAIVGDEEERSHLAPLPAIIESPMLQRSAGRALDPDRRSISARLLHRSNSNRLFRSNRLQSISHRFWKHKSHIPQSFSNYEVSSVQSIFRSTGRYPSTPLLAAARDRLVNEGDFYSSSPLVSPMATFEDDTSDEDSISDTITFRSCLNSLHERSEYDNTEMTTSLSGTYADDSCLDEGFHSALTTATKKRSAFRQFCFVQ